MPNSDTFSVKPIGDFVRKYCINKISVDPFARNSEIGDYRNDINPNTIAPYHMDAEAFLLRMAAEGFRFSVGIFDPPYSPRQISECYKEAGIKCGMVETQNASLYKRVKTAMLACLTADAVMLSFGWNSAGMGIKNGFEITEIQLVCHGAAHNDTICMAEIRKS